MKRFITTPLLLAGLILTLLAKAQTPTPITGKVVNSKDQPVGYATVAIIGANISAVTDTSGNFHLLFAGKGKKIVHVSSVGYKSKDIEINVNDPALHLDIVLTNETRTLGDIVVSAGSFQASDKAKGASLSPMDAVTVAGTGGDLANSLRWLPGAQQIGEKEGLFVRGGTSAETKQFVDGTLLPVPNYASVPGLPQPARLNPFLFSGILFSTGGYSALYGDALSSALILESVGLPEKSSASLHIFPTAQGAGFQGLAKNNKSSYGVNFNYGGQQWYNNIVAQKPDFFKGPEYLSSDANFRIKTSRTGMLKFYTSYNYSNVGMRNPDIDSTNLLDSYQTRGTNIYSNLSYSAMIAHNWKMDAGVAYNYNRQYTTTRLLDRQSHPIFLADTPYDAKNAVDTSAANFAQTRLVLTRFFAHRQALRFGGEYFYNRDIFNNPSANATDHFLALFAETDFYISPSVAAKTGVRYEHSSLLNSSTLAPRISMAYKLDDGGQINLGYGVFYEKPEPVFLAQSIVPGFNKASHYILNYQKKANNRLFRVEAYYKSYDHLTTTFPKPGNDGDGYARGLELFFRDKKTFKNLDYWITYTYLDTRRRYLNYPEKLQPDFATPHTASVAIKKFFPDLNFSANCSYSIATGRPYYDIQNSAAGKTFIFDKGTTKMYNNMNLSFAYLFTMFPKWKNKDYSGIGFGCNNVFGAKQVFGYNYSYTGLVRTPITAPAVRFYYIGLFMTFGINRRDDFINENL
jgi:vitamin B12 transporter